MNEDKLLTTGDVARYCHVSITAVKNWINQGKLKSFQMPGGQRKVLISDLILFIKNNKMHMPKVLKKIFQSRKVQVIDKSKAIYTKLKELIETDDMQWEASYNNEIVGALINFGMILPDVVILNANIEFESHVTIVQKMQKQLENKQLKIVLVGPQYESRTIKKLVNENEENVYYKELKDKDIKDILEKAEEAAKEEEKTFKMETEEE